MNTTSFFIFQIIVLIGLMGNKTLKINSLKVILIGLLQLLIVFLFRKDTAEFSSLYYIFGGGYIAFGLFLMFYNKKNRIA